MAVSTNGVKPYVIQRRQAILVFEEPEYEGIHIKARLDVDLRTFLDLQSLAGGGDSKPDDLRAAFSMFGDEILQSWNLEASCLCLRHWRPRFWAHGLKQRQHRGKSQPRHSEVEISPGRYE